MNNSQEGKKKKKCASCGETVFGDLLACTKCGKGIFEAEITRDPDSFWYWDRQKPPSAENPHKSLPNIPRASISNPIGRGMEVLRRFFGLKKSLPDNTEQLPSVPNQAAIISKTHLFVEIPCADESIQPESVKIDVPFEFIEFADKELQLHGELSSYVRNNLNSIKVKKIKRLLDNERQSFYTNQSSSSKWQTYFQSTEAGYRYSILVEYDIEAWLKRELMNGPARDLTPEKLIRDHFARILPTLRNDHAGNWTRAMIQKVIDEELEEISLLATEKMNGSLTGGDRESVAVFKGDLFISISTFPCSIKEAKQRYYQSGYLSYLDRVLNYGRNQNPRSHWFHFQFFWDGKTFWTQFTLFPNKDILDFIPMYILPVDLLSDKERQDTRL